MGFRFHFFGAVLFFLKHIILFQVFLSPRSTIDCTVMLSMLFWIETEFFYKSILGIQSENDVRLTTLHIKQPLM